MDRTKLFVTKAMAVHGDLYDYTKAVYVNQVTPVTVGCREHGDFDVIPKTHIRKVSPTGCPVCGVERRKIAKLDTTKTFIDKARAIHGDRYDYSKVDYVKSSMHVTIICPDHGAFSKKPNGHITGKQGCPVCASIAGAEKQKITQTEFINKARVIYGDRYDLTDAIYDGANTRITVRCIEHDHTSTPLASAFLNNIASCPTCASQKHKDAILDQAISWDQFVRDAVNTHDDQYQYVMPTDWDLNTSRLQIECPTHGQFTQLAKNHRSGRGCPQCGVERSADIKRKRVDEFITECRAVHGDLYDYSRVDYRNTNHNVTIICPEHGEFSQRPHNHIQGYGCPTCGVGTSVGETEIASFIDELGLSHQKRTKIDGVEFDICVTDKDVLIEYCGNYWHSQSQGKTRTYHLSKLTHATNRGYRLLTIFEDEWQQKPDIVKSRIRNILGKSPKGVGARKLTISEIDFPTARDFINLHHIQGSTTQMKLRYGAYHGDKLVAVMTFNKSRHSLGGDGSVTELVRFVTDGASYPGVGSKLLAAFRRSYGGVIMSYADRRWSDGNLYTQLGFVMADPSNPNYWYMKRSNYLKRFHRYVFRKSELLKKFDASSEHTEWQIMQDNGYDRIWDCGNLKFILE